MDAPEDVKTILFVEDEPLVRMLGIRILTGLGYRVIDAENGLVGVETYKNIDAAIDMVITDVIMPKMTGPEMVNKLREMQPKLKVIFVSGYTSADCESQINVGKYTNFLQKPYTASELGAQIQTMLRPETA